MKYEKLAIAVMIFILLMTCIVGIIVVHIKQIEAEQPIYIAPSSVEIEAKPKKSIW